MALDLATLLIVSQCVSIACGLLLLVEYLRQPSSASRWFTAGFLFAPVATIFYVGLADDRPWLVVIGNWAAAMAVVCTWFGARSFHGRPPAYLIGFVGPAVMTALVLATTRRFDAWSGAVPFLLTFSLFCFLSAAEFWRGKAGEPRLQNSVILTGGCAINGTLYLSRTIAYLWLGPDDPLFLQFFGPEISVLLLTVIIVVSSFSLVSLSTERAHLATRHAATHDGLTGVLNRAAFESRAQQALAKGATGAPSSLLLLDLDHFKQVNDRFGHPAGDRVLITITGIAEGNLRKSDFIGRYGGEEFAIFLPGASANEAWAISERIRQALHVEPDSLFAAIRPTISVGVATSGATKATLSALMAAADTALYHAKASGRDRSVVHTDGEPLENARAIA